MAVCRICDATLTSNPAEVNGPYGENSTGITLLESQLSKALGQNLCTNHFQTIIDGEENTVITLPVVTAVESTGLTFDENKGITLDAALSADGKWSGTVEPGTSGAALAFGDIIYQVASDAQWELAKADVAATSDGKLGICLTATGSAGNAITILLWGKVRADAVFPALSVRRPVYISAATAGDITSTKPSGTTNFVVRIIGYANTADELFFCPDNTYVELA